MELKIIINVMNGIFFDFSDASRVIKAGRAGSRINIPGETSASITEIGVFCRNLTYPYLP